MALTELWDAACQGWSPPFTGEVYEYGANLNLQNGYAIKGQFDVSRSKYLVEPFKALRNRRIRQIVLLKAVQTGGSLIADIWVPYCIEHDPGELLWLFQDDDFQAKFTQERFLPLMKNTASLLAYLEDADRVKLDTILFKHMPMVMGGLNEGNCQGLSRQKVIIDECWLAGNNGLIRQAKARTAGFPHTKKILMISQAGVEGDDLDLEWRQTDMREWNWQCPSCLAHQPFEMGRKRDDGTYAGLNWETNEITKPNGRWNYSRVGATAKLECFHCGHKIEDTPANRRRIDDTHKYIATNPDADSTLAGFHWPAIANVDISFASVCIAYLQAKVQKEEQMYELPMKEFWQKVLAKPWPLRGSEEYAPITTEAYDVNAAWPEEKYRFVIADCQKELKKFFVGVFAVSQAGEARELARETVESFDGIAEIQKKWNVRDQRVFLDCGYSMTKVLRECVRRGHIGWQTHGTKKVKMWLCWTGLKGSGQETFTHIHPRTKQPESRIYSERKFYDVNEGTSGKDPRAPYYEWSNLHCKDLFRARRDCEPGAPKFLTLPCPLSADDEWSYANQVRSERRIVEIKNGKKRAIWLPVKDHAPNHEFDKSAMLMAIMAICGIIGGTQEQKEAE